MAARLTADGQGLVLTGPSYINVLAEAHGRLRPRAYFEIGTLHGDTLGLARCRSAAVDPCFQLAAGALRGDAEVRLFEMTSDSFFAEQDLATVLGGPVDMAFLDGMHRFDFLLRDFINTERACAPGAVVLMHDCLPPEAAVTGGEEGRPGLRAWTGDVWKMIPVLRQWRPDLTLAALDARPTGLTVCTGLNPADRTLSTHYEAIVGAWEDVRLDTFGLDRLVAEARPRSARDWLSSLPREAWASRGRRWRDRLQRSARARLAAFALTSGSTKARPSPTVAAEG